MKVDEAIEIPGLPTTTTTTTTTTNNNKCYLTSVISSA